jgi:hypothetical protein
MDKFLNGIHSFLVIFKLLLHPGLIGFLERINQFVEIVGLFQVFECAEPCAFHGRVHRGVPGQHDDFNKFMVLFENLEDLSTVGSRHLQVHHRHIEPPFIGRFDGIFSIACRRYVEALDGQPSETACKNLTSSSTKRILIIFSVSMAPSTCVGCKIDCPSSQANVCDVLPYSVWPAKLGVP